MRHAFLLLALVSLSACYRQDVRWVDIRIPDATGATDLDDLRSRLLSMNAMMPKDQPLYMEINAIPEPPGLAIRYDARLQSIKNIEHEIARMGFQANDIPGDAARRDKTRETFHRTRGGNG
jgi:hypothetical protein